jgi:hypothetical protein
MLVNVDNLSSTVHGVSDQYTLLGMVVQLAYVPGSQLHWCGEFGWKCKILQRRREIQQQWMQLIDGCATQMQTVLARAAWRCQSVQQLQQSTSNTNNIRIHGSDEG